MVAEGRISAGVELIPGYELVSKLGQGGFGAVWQANGPGNIPIALKLIELGDSDAGFREFKSLELLRELRHPNLLPVHAYWVLDDEGQVINGADQADMLVIAMLLAEKSLRQVLRSCRKKHGSGIPVQELLEYMRDAARGLDFLNSPNHKLGDELVSIQHRDIKPENLLVVGGGVMVADFGIAKVLAPGARSSYTEHISLTLAYGAPELFEGRATPRTDQYSLALTYYELLTGRLPFDKDVTPASVVNVHMKGTHDFSLVDENYQGILRKATSPNPSNRYATCIDMVNALAAVHRDGGVAVTGNFCGLQSESTHDGIIDATQPLKAVKAAVDDESSSGPTTNTRFPTASQFTTQTTEVAKRSLGTIAIIAWIAVAGAAGGWWFANRQKDAPVADVGAANPIPASKLAVADDKADEKSAAEVEAPAAASSDEAEVARQMNTSEAPSVREQAAAALLAKEYEQALAAYNKVADTVQATAEDFASRAEARRGLAASGKEPAANLVHAATDFLKAGMLSEAAAAHHDAARAYDKQAEEQHELDAKDSEAVLRLDEQAEQQFRQAIELAAALALPTRAAWEAELAAREQHPRIANRIAMSVARAAMPEVARQLAESPNDAELLLRAARLEETLGDVTAAAAHFARGHSLSAIALARAGKLEEASQAFAAAIKYDPNQQSSLTNFANGILLAARDDLSSALRAFTAAIELADDEVQPVWEVLRERARLHAGNDETALAVADLRAAIDRYPTEVSAAKGRSVSADQKNISLLHANIATLLEKSVGQATDAQSLEATVAAFRQAATYDPSTLAYQLGAARNLVRLVELDPAAPRLSVKYAEADSLIGEVLARDNAIAEAHFLDGRVNLFQEKAATAQQAFARAVATIDDERDVELKYQLYSNQATAYLLDPRDDAAALAAAEQAIELNETGLVGQYCRAMALRNLKKLPESIRGFDVVLSIDPDHVASLLARSQLIVEQPESTKQEREAARRDIDRGLSLANTDALKAEAHYVASLAWLKTHIDGSSDADVGEPALLSCQTTVLNALRLAPSNAVYRKAGEQVFGYAKRYDWHDAARGKQSAKLQEEYAKMP